MVVEAPGRQPLRRRAPGPVPGSGARQTFDYDELVPATRVAQLGVALADSARKLAIARREIAKLRRENAELRAAQTAGDVA
jgi:hypothetical protein